MSSKKVYVKDYVSLLECRLEGGQKTSSLQKADIVVNPTCGSLYSKTVIINLPVTVPIETLKSNNLVVSRFKIQHDIPVIKFKLPENRKEISDDLDFSFVILNKRLLQSVDFARLVEKSNFLLGLDVEVEGDITAVGHLLLRTKLEDLL